MGTLLLVPKKLSEILRGWHICTLTRKLLSLRSLLVLGILALTVLASLPLFQFKLMTGHDSYAYLPRVVEFYQGLKAGELFPRWAPDLGGGYGYPIFNFVPPLFYYVSALFHFLGMPIIASMDLACFLALLLSGLGMYLFAREFFGPYGGFLAGIAYVFAPYHLATLYVRSALGDFMAFAFIPLTLWGIYRFCRDGKHLFLVMASLSLALLILSSNHVALISLPLFILYIAFLAFTARKLACLLRGGLCLATGLSITAFFWLPALLERGFVKVDRALTGYFDYNDHFVYPHQLIYSPWGYGLSLPGPDDGMSFQIGLVHLVLLIISLVTVKRARLVFSSGKRHLIFFTFIFISAAFFTIHESAFLWARLPLLQYLQFPWRILTLVVVAVSFACGFPFLFLEEGNIRAKNALLGLCVVAILLFNLPFARPEGAYDIKGADFTPDYIAGHQVKVMPAHEWEPIWVQDRPSVSASGRLVLVRGQVTNLLARSVSPTGFTYRLEPVKNSLMRANIFYFPGWKVYVDGREAKIYVNKSGLMDFYVAKGIHEVRVEFTDTLVRKWGKGLSVFGFVLMLLTSWLFKPR